MKITYQAVCDFLALGQFLDCCSRELYLYLNPKPFKALGKLAHGADLIDDAKGCVPICVAKGQHKNKVIGQAQPKVQPNQDQRPVVKCKICDKPYPTYKCWNNPVIQIGVRIGTVVELTSVTINMIIMIITITGPTIRSFFVKLIVKVRM